MDVHYKGICCQFDTNCLHTVFPSNMFHYSWYRWLWARIAVVIMSDENVKSSSDADSRGWHQRHFCMFRALLANKNRYSCLLSAILFLVWIFDIKDIVIIFHNCCNHTTVIWCHSVGKFIMIHTIAFCFILACAVFHIVLEIAVTSSASTTSIYIWERQDQLP